MIFGSKVIVSDPCYHYGTWCTSTVEILPGEYRYGVKKQNIPGWGVRVESISIIHKDYNNVNWKLTTADIGVDSGQCGIFDYETNKDIIGTGEYDQKDTFYGKACTLTLSDDQFGVMDNSGIVSCSGFGDGSYDLYIAKNEQKQVIALKVVFITDEEDEDE